MIKEMINLIQYLRYLSAFSILKLANQLAGNEDPNCILEHLFKWKSFDNGFEEAKQTEKPIFLFVYKIGCPACEVLKEKFSKSVRIMDLSDRFVMIKVDARKHPSINSGKFQPDGKYVPRILFFTSDGEFIMEAFNRSKNAKEQKFFYSSPSDVTETMLFVLNEYSKEPKPLIFEWTKSNLKY
ncbi:thioredoxin domain-containing protein 12 [Megalopta genalis]|uniref:thioredoxin domain-containing protein 12 n=1 Tax=Megalopta genalis TaxID=115081 RepID=UPI0014435213|nr:thioredoxin domain-containing protein 12-like [Megalopta genalis]